MEIFGLTIVNIHVEEKPLPTSTYPDFEYTITLKLRTDFTDKYIQGLFEQLHLGLVNKLEQL